MPLLYIRRTEQGNPLRVIFRTSGGLSIACQGDARGRLDISSQDGFIDTLG